MNICRDGRVQNMVVHLHKSPGLLQQLLRRSLLSHHLLKLRVLLG